MERKLTVWRKWKKRKIQKWWIYFEGKSTLKRFGFNNPSSGLYKISVNRTTVDV